MFEGGLRVKMESIDSSFHFRQPQCEYGNRIIVIVMMDSVPVFQQVLKIKKGRSSFALRPVRAATVFLIKRHITSRISQP
jgi:hypothetical protein